MDESLLTTLAPLGVGGILAGVMFMLYRKDMREFVANWAGQTQLLIAVVKENTAAITALIEVVRSLEAVEKAKGRV